MTTTQKVVEEIKRVIGHIVRIGNDIKDPKGKIISTGHKFTSEKTGKSGLNIEVCELSTGKFWQLTLFGQLAFFSMKGQTVDLDENENAILVQNHEPLRVGQLISAKGPYELRPFVSKKTGLPGHKDSIRIFGDVWKSIKIISFPSETPPEAHEVAKKTTSRRRAS